MLAASLVLTAAATGCGEVSRASQASSRTAPLGTAAPMAAARVPAKYRSLFDQVSHHLDAYEHAVAAMPRARPMPRGRPPIAGVELLAANGNRLSALLQPGTMQLVDVSLDRFRTLGLGGVTLGIKVPMLLGSFSPDAQRYADFYATVAKHIRARRMAVSVELGALFCGTVYASCTNPFAASYQTFVADTAAQARTVIKRLHPDYLTIISEPDTEARLTGVRALDTPAIAARAVADIVARIGPRGRTRVGAGAGTWLPTSFAQAIAAQRVDYLDTHTYPVGRQDGANAVAIAAIAHKRRKPLVADEVWLYKSAEPGIGSTIGAAEQAFRQDMFSFWEPLDARFLATTATWARKAGAIYVSAFWSWQFFTYLTWTPALDLDLYPQLTATFNQTVLPALVGGETTALARQWSHELRSTRTHI
ncbi:MAG: hypothetical protein ACXVV5_26425 [Solirubrobacteraceae bacterium]